MTKRNVCFLTLRFWAARIGIETLKQDKPKTEPGKYSLPIDPSAVQLWRLWRISISVLSGWSSGPGTSNILLQWDVYTVCVCICICICIHIHIHMHMHMHIYIYTYPVNHNQQLNGMPSCWSNLRTKKDRKGKGFRSKEWVTNYVAIGHPPYFIAKYIRI